MSEKRKACANCARAKSKCVWPSSDDESTCLRCSKTSLTCTTRTSTGPKKKRGKGLRAKMMEQKLDDIITILNKGQDSTASSPAMSSGASVINPDYSMSLGQAPQTAFDPSSTRPTDRADGDEEKVPGFPITFAEADQALRYYSSDLLPQFPFVPLPVWTARELHAARPLLLKIILRVCHPLNPEQDAEFEKWFRQDVAYRVMVLMEKSTELLQAILVYLTWNVIQFYVSGYDSSFIQIAIGLVGDLGLAKFPVPISVVDESLHLKNETRPRPKTHTNSDRRATLGVFYIASQLSCLLGKVCRLEYINYMDESCQTLLDSNDYDTDPLLVYLVRLRKISIKVSDMYSGRNDHIYGAESWRTHAMAIATVHKELDTFMDNLPRSLKNHHLLRNDCAAIRIRLFEPVINSSSPTPDPTLLRTRLMWDCLQCAQGLFTSFLEIPPNIYSSFTFISLLHLAIAMLRSIKLLNLDNDVDWDMQTARRSCDLVEFLRKLSDRFEAGLQCPQPRATLIKDGRYLAERYAERFRWIMNWHASRVAPRTGGTNGSGPLFGDESLFMSNTAQGAEFWQQLTDWEVDLDMVATEFGR